MASNAQIATFAKEWGPSANTASKQLGIPANWIIAQWGYETGWGTGDPVSSNNNPGNLGGAMHLMSFSTKPAFVTAYVSAMKNDFPFFNSIAYRGIDAKGVPSIGSVYGGNQTYDPGNTTYANKVAQALQTLNTVTGSKTGLTAPYNPGLQYMAPSVSKGYSLPSWLVIGAQVAIGIVFIIVGILMVAKDEESNLIANSLSKVV